MQKTNKEYRASKNCGTLTKDLTFQSSESYKKKTKKERAKNYSKTL